MRSSYRVNFFKTDSCSVIAAHPWLRSENHPIPLDILIYKLVKSYLHASPFKRAALKVLFSFCIVRCVYCSMIDFTRHNQISILLLFCVFIHTGHMHVHLYVIDNITDKPNVCLKHMPI